MRKNIATAELADGTIIGPVRVLYADKLKYETSARHNGWNLTDEIRGQGFLAWAAFTRTGEISLSYDEFVEQIADVTFEVVETEGSTDPTHGTAG